MFNLADSWHWWLLVLAIVIMAIIERYRAMGLKSPENELSKLRFSMILFGIVAFFVYFTQPHFFYYSYVPTEFHTLEDAHKVITDLDAGLKEVNENLEQVSGGLYLVLIALFVSVLPAIYNFAKAIVPNDPEDDGKDMISIFGRDKESK